ncbi:MAG: hypothetical protein J6D54_12915, partial [Olsenella sp.]|nr:hypothetical protein [Olsenella sp.]
MERELNEDPMTYETRPIFGMWSKRQTAIGAVVIVATAALAALAWRLGADPMYVGGACALAGIPVGVFGLSRRHGLLPEEWIPLARAEREAP